jgi:prevent-host-death family protein
MLEVQIDRIISVTDARNNFNKIVEDVERGDMYVLTKGGTPTVAIVSVSELEKLAQGNPEVKENPQETRVQETRPIPVNPNPPTNLASFNKEESSLAEEKPLSAPPQQSFIQRNAPMASPKPTPQPTSQEDLANPKPPVSLPSAPYSAIKPEVVQPAGDRPFSPLAQTSDDESSEYNP